MKLFTILVIYRKPTQPKNGQFAPYEIMMTQKSVFQGELQNRSFYRDARGTKMTLESWQLLLANNIFEKFWCLKISGKPQKIHDMQLSITFKGQVRYQMKAYD